jgi:predicted transcriptional regulator
LTWLINKGLVLKQGKKYQLTEKGMTLYELASNSTTTILKIWENLNNELTDNDLK